MTRQFQIQAFQALHAEMGSRRSSQSLQEQRWKQVIAGHTFFKDQMWQVTDMRAQAILDFGGFKENLGVSNSEVSLTSVITMYPENQFANLMPMVRTLFESATKYKAHGAMQGFFLHYLQDASGTLIPFQRRSVCLDFDENYHAMTYLTIYQRVVCDHFPQEIQGWLRGRGRERILHDWNQDQTVNGVSLTRREREILGWMVRGATSHEVAQQLAISPHTVDTVRRRVLTKCGAKGTADLVARFAGVKLCE